MPFPVSRTGMRTSCPFQSPSPTSWTRHVRYACQLFNGDWVLLIRKAIIVQFYLAGEATFQLNCQMLDNDLFSYFEFGTLCPFGYIAQRKSYLQYELILLNNIIWLLIIQLYWFMSCNGRSSLYRHESSSEMRPEDQLYQISIMGSEYQEQNRFGKFGVQDNKQTKRKQAKIVNKKSIEQDSQSIVQWMDLCGANQRLRRQRKKVKKAQRNGEVAKSESPGLNTSGMYKIIVKNSNDQCDNKFMSMAELCHRYTFVNQHGGHSKYFAAQKKFNNSNQIKQQSQSDLKGYFNEYQEEMLYKTKYNFLGRSKNPKQIKLPSVKKVKDTQNNKKTQTEYLQKILKFLQKSNSKKKIQVRFAKNSKGMDDIDLKIDNSKNKQPNKQKINWKKSQRYNGKPQEDMQLSLSKSQKSILESNELNPNRSSSEMKNKKILISMKGAGLDFSLRNQKVNKRISKSLQQCLILSKK